MFEYCYINVPCNQIKEPKCQRISWFHYFLWLTVDDGREDRHALKVGIAHCPVQYKASETGKHKHRGENECHGILMSQWNKSNLVRGLHGCCIYSLNTSFILHTSFLLTLSLKFQLHGLQRLKIMLEVNTC